MHINVCAGPAYLNVIMEYKQSICLHGGGPTIQCLLPSTALERRGGGGGLGEKGDHEGLQGAERETFGGAVAAADKHSVSCQGDRTFNPRPTPASLPPLLQIGTWPASLSTHTTQLHPGYPQNL